MLERNDTVLSLLKPLERAYPQGVGRGYLQEMFDGFGKEQERALFMMQEEGLIEAKISYNAMGLPKLLWAKITPKGQRYLAGEKEPGSIKRHGITREELRVMLLGAVAQTTLPVDRLDALQQAIGAAPTAALEELVQRVLVEGFQHSPELLRHIKACLPESFGLDDLMP